MKESTNLVKLVANQPCVGTTPTLRRRDGVKEAFDHVSDMQVD